ncbi:MAG TPA: Stp1/IreP family PP2C-type Ser/Thr phosphatase [Gemmatimonadaceae bacterium]|nr:Stp1/IreP family PP2C-type Ser/Thr phosphatase [Gemmatimonadaceae bacterium]
MTLPTPSETPVPRPGVQLRLAGMTDVGVTREHNEDAFAVLDLSTGQTDAELGDGVLDVGLRGVVLVVADGMGGAAAGEIASEMAVEAVLDTFRAQWMVGVGRDTDSFVETIRDAADTANHRIFAYAGAHPEHAGMGTTATIAGLLGNSLYLAQVGDSRAYIVRDGEARQITKDQSLMQQLIEAGEMTPDQAEVSERRNIILQALGPDSTVRPDFTQQPVARGDTLVMCSDGLTTHLRASDIARIVTASRDPEIACEQLIAAANAEGGHDNITVVVVEFDGDGLPAHDELQREIGHQSYPLPDSGVPMLDRMRGRMRSGAVPAVTRPPTPALGVQGVSAPESAAASAIPPRDPAKAYLYVAVFAVVVLVGWAIWNFGKFGSG